ncbi:PTS sugar transporter subunit IIBC [Lactobacillus paracasei subsp. paracasei]|jgi:glucose-like phosphotransferase system IIB component|uniref:PTS transporter subunit EIIB n=1 Tax=Lacticaseibacillus paracasei TaxID=1597 RepID=UPI0018C45788|nr:PTS transporter subunit EIIB [Lacticaseibacillus paracasei]MBG1272270.1 PTS sugar transporter subunit IIBC [Lacticaseibacillus paracasei subsp. paracasei]MEA0974300.1 PTS transporter subunit EIIB [Lacticaseibacillus paracasei]
MKGTYRDYANAYLYGLGGIRNIKSLINCATRIRAEVKDPTKVLHDSYFREQGAIAITRYDTMFQVIVGLNAPQIIDEMREQLNGHSLVGDGLNEYGLTEYGERAALISECFGSLDNILRVSTSGSAVVVQVKDPSWVDSFDVMLQLDIGIRSVKHRGKTVYVYIDDAVSIARELSEQVAKNG